MFTFDYALIRIVPRVSIGDAETVGLILQCRQRRFIGVRWCDSPEALASRWPEIGDGLVHRYLHAFESVASGEGPLGRFTASERFHWLTAPRSTVVQPSPVHTGMTQDPESMLDQMASSLRA